MKVVAFPVSIRVVQSITVVIIFFASFAATAKTSLEIGWGDLIGQVEPYEDPFRSLSSDQIMDLSVVARIRERRDRSGELSGGEIAELHEKERALKAQGIDVDYVLGQRELIKAKRIAAAEAFNDSLDGRRIRMPGYLLPLEFDGDRVTDFLLVPFVGACIHVPPPPPNQIVSVVYPAGFENKGLFAPIWVEGEIRVGKTEKDLYLKDGSADVFVGYSLVADRIEPYETPQ